MISFLILIPWIQFGFQNPQFKCIGLSQTKRSLILLLIVETIFYLALYMALPEPNPEVAGVSSFGWKYLFIFYAKGIVPAFAICETLEGTLGDRIDTNYQFVYYITSLLMDYLILLIISPEIKKRLFRNSNT